MRWQLKSKRLIDTEPQPLAGMKDGAADAFVYPYPGLLDPFSH
jgi:hypothetical protein